MLILIEFYRYVSCLCKSYYLAKNPDHWANIAWSLALPYDEVLDYHPEFQNYKRGESIKQADAILLGFPLQYPMNMYVCMFIYYVCMFFLLIFNLGNNIVSYTINN